MEWSATSSQEGGGLGGGGVWNEEGRPPFIVERKSGG